MLLAEPAHKFVYSYAPRLAGGRLRLSNIALPVVLTISNLVVGSSIQVESEDGMQSLYLGSTYSSSKTIVIRNYLGLARMRVKVRKASSAPYYRPYETLVSAYAPTQSLYVSQTQDE